MLVYHIFRIVTKIMFIFKFIQQGMFEPHLKSFFVHANDPTHIRLLKVCKTLQSMELWVV